ncbi:MAG: HDIG domain-containing metalloprotein [Flavitalea sp.]
MAQNINEVQKIVDEIFSLYEKYGNEEYGEGVTQMMHMVQAGNLAREGGLDVEMVLASFFHDIGHLLEHGSDMDGFGKKDHDRLGHDYLIQKGFSERVALLVASHVPAKRYLTAIDKDYYDNLSHASRTTLGFQGGPMTTEEVAAYQKDPLLDEYIQVRTWDDLAKETDLPVEKEDVEYFKKLTFDYLSNR